jgi:hypothetical protein
MGFATVELFRNYTGIKKQDLEDNDVMMLFDEADKATLEQIICRVYNEELSGDIDSSNTLFTTKFKPIADINRDRTVNASDVTVYLVDLDSENNPSSTATTVSTVTSRDGIITLSTAPTTDNAEVGVFADYAYWKNINAPDWDRVAQASCYYAAYLASQRSDFGIVGPDFLALWRKTIKSIVPNKGFVHGNEKAKFNVGFVRD